MPSFRTRQSSRRTRWHVDPGESRLTLQVSGCRSRDFSLQGAEGSLELVESELLGTTLRGRVPESTGPEDPGPVSTRVDFSGSVVAVRDDGALELEGRLRTEDGCHPLALVVHLGRYRQRDGTEMLDLVVRGPLSSAGCDATRMEAKLRVYRAR